MKRRLLSILCSLGLALAFMPAAAIALENPSDDPGLALNYASSTDDTQSAMHDLQEESEYGIARLAANDAGSGTVSGTMSSETFLAAIDSNNNLTLEDDVTLTDILIVEKKLTLDLAGHTLNTGTNIFATRGSNLVTIRNGTIAGSGRDYPDYGLVLVQSNGNIVMSGVTIDVTTDINGVQVNEGSTASITGCTINSAGNGIAVGGSASSIITDTIINASGNFGVVTNGTDDAANAKANIIMSGCTIATPKYGMYLPSCDGVTSITNTSITASSTGIEIRGGSLTITGDTKVSTTAQSYAAFSDESGTSVNGAAIAISQHVTNNPIHVTIENGTFTGPASIGIASPETANDNQMSEGFSLEIKGGDYTGTVDVPSDLTVAGTDSKVGRFVSGGTFKDTDGTFTNDLVDSDSLAVGLGDTYYAGEQADDAISGLKGTETLEVINAPKGIDNVPEGVKVVNNSGSDISVNGQTVPSDASPVVTNISASPSSATVEVGKSQSFEVVVPESINVEHVTGITITASDAATTGVQKAIEAPSMVSAPVDYALETPEMEMPAGYAMAPSEKALPAEYAGITPRGAISTATQDQFNSEYVELVSKSDTAPYTFVIKGLKATPKDNPVIISVELDGATHGEDYVFPTSAGAETTVEVTVVEATDKPTTTPNGKPDNTGSGNSGNKGNIGTVTPVKNPSGSNATASFGLTNTGDNAPYALLAFGSLAIASLVISVLARRFNSRN